MLDGPPRLVICDGKEAVCAVLRQGASARKRTVKIGVNAKEREELWQVHGQCTMWPYQHTSRTRLKVDPQMHINVRRVTRVTICLVGRPIGAWRTDWRYTLAPSEEIMSAAAVRLRDTGTGTTTPMIAVGVADCYGEDYPCLGPCASFPGVLSISSAWILCLRS